MAICEREGRGELAAETVAVDDDTLAACRAGERAAQRRLYERCARPVYRLVARMVGRQEAAGGIL